MKEELLSYMAGFFDGEGYIGILKRKRGTWNEYFIQVSIGQKDGDTMDWIRENFGGHLHLVKRDGSFYWVISNSAGYKFLKQIVPFLRYKKPQAEKAIEFYEGRPYKKHGQARVGNDEYARREKIYQEMKAMKRIFSKANLINNVSRFND